MTPSSIHRLCVLALLAFSCVFSAHAQVNAPSPSTVAAAWTMKLNDDISWQQVTPAGALLVSTTHGLSGIDTDAGTLTWQKPELRGILIDDVRPLQGSLLMEATREGLDEIFDPVTGAVVFDSRKADFTKVITRRVLPQSGMFLVHGQHASGGAGVALYDLATGKQLWQNESLFAPEEAPKRRGFGALMQGLTQLASQSTELQVLQAGPEMIVVHTLTGLRGLDARSGNVRWSATLPRGRFAALPHHVQLYPSVEKADRIYVSFDDSLMAYRVADGQALWPQPAKVDGWIRDIVQHPAGIVMLPEAPPENEATGSRRVVNGVAQTGLNVARYEDGTTVLPKPLRMHGTVIDTMIAGNSVVLTIDAESKTFVNVLDVSTATLRLKKDAKIKGQLSYAELTAAGLLYISRPDASVNAEVNIIDLASGEPRFQDAIESGKPLSSNEDTYNAARYYLHHAVEGKLLYVFANRDHKLYAVDREAGTFKAFSTEIKLQGGEDPTAMEIRPEGIVLSSPQNLVIVGRDAQIKQQVYYPAPQLPGLLRALYAINAVRVGLYGAAASAYGDAFSQASHQSSDPSTQYIAGQLANAYNQAGQQLQGYSRQSAALATKRFKASLNLPAFLFMLTKAPDGKGNVLLQIDKTTAQTQARVNLGKENEPAYAVDDIADMLFLQSAPGTLVAYRLKGRVGASNLVSEVMKSR